MALSDPILVLDEKNRVLDLNPSAEGLFAIPRMESIGCDIGDLIDHHAQWIDCSPAVQTREINLPVDGAERCFDVRVSGLKGVNGTMAGRMFVFHDISERKKADLALWESERLQGVLEMAGAVCSDLSKPIRAISACSNKLIEGVDGDEVLYPKTLKLNEQTKRIEEIIQRLTRITRYETRNYLGRKIVDLEKSSIEEAQP